MSFDWINDEIQAIDAVAMQAALERQAQLTKPPGSLGRLEEVAVRLAAMQATQDLKLNNIQIVVFAGDHGIAAEGVSAFPQAVTAEMVKNFARGGAAISVMAKQLNASLEVVDVGTVVSPGEFEGVVDQRVAAGTENFLKQAAMSQVQLAQAMTAGRDAVLRAKDKGTQLFIGGDMGIANTTAATAIACSLLNKTAEELAGPGTGLDASGVKHKASIIQSAIEQHKKQMLGQPLEILRHVGGFEIAALCGAYMTCAQKGIPFIVDGFIASSAALVAIYFNKAVRQWMFLAHRSAEPGHRQMVEAMGIEPLLDLGLRLGEGSGAAMAVPVLQMAIATHTQMATFAEAGVSDQD
ncbi:MAG: nicotinate-nucleotide--dimethylbenzimidazole phosphoribosyltransferase [Gammaproteobacteria bacterium]|nr:nicotinate-nucleotide--dimethylbenzimidazole phosphoribosyltransferase [Gammaproteobacteria bacterium]